KTPLRHTGTFARRPQAPRALLSAPAASPAALIDPVRLLAHALVERPALLPRTGPPRLPVIKAPAAPSSTRRRPAHADTPAGRAASKPGPARTPSTPAPAGTRPNAADAADAGRTSARTRRRARRAPRARRAGGSVPTPTRRSGTPADATRNTRRTPRRRPS